MEELEVRATQLCKKCRGPEAHTQLPAITNGRNASLIQRFAIALGNVYMYQSLSTESIATLNCGTARYMQGVYKVRDTFVL